MSLHLLPVEVVEQVLLSTAEAGFPHAIAAFAQTSKLNCTLVYSPRDQHLWRQVFLSTFDDPRASGGGPGWGECTSGNRHSEDDFEWDTEFRRRVWAADYIRRQTSLAREVEQAFKEGAAPNVEVTHRNIRAFDALLSVISTALPCPPTIVFSFLPPPSGPPDTSAPLTPTSNYPTFPPLPQAISGFTNSVTTVGPTDSTGRSFGHTLRANNIAWLADVLANGLPPEVTALFCGERWVGGVTGRDLDESQFREMQAAGHLIACTGFLPIPSALSHFISPPVTAMRGERACSSETHSTSSGNDAGKALYRSSERQLKRARRLARMRVYNMHYLSRARHWGPYLPVETTEGNATRATPEDSDMLLPLFALIGAHGRPHTQDNDPEDQDEDAHMSDDAGDDDDDIVVDEMDNDEEAEGEDVFEDEDEDEEDADAVDDGSVPAPTSAQLRADWAHLAAVRVVVEANLRESFQASELRGLFSLDGLRRGSAPWDASAYKPPQSIDEMPEEVGKGKEKSTESDDVWGWDWAGVTGVWMRCVCWLDYRDLILNNMTLYDGFEDPHLSEAVRIISMRLRIKAYSPADVPKYAHLPNIHIEGETMASTIPGRPRSMHGMVSVMSDGNVRWTLCSSIEGGTRDEWVSEGVQVGGVASAMGVLGLWTGASHQRMDPLGPCWAWKVG